MTFMHPGYLWALFALLVPIVIHLFNFRRYRKVYFSNVERLRELYQESHRSRRMRSWWLLAVRLLAVTALVLAFAHPVVVDEEAQVGVPPTGVIVYIDNSFSMENAGSQGSQLDVTCQKAREIASTYSPSTRFMLLTGDLRGEEFRWINRDEYVGLLDDISIGSSSRRLADVVQRLHTFLTRQGMDACHAFVISDFQRSCADLDALPCGDSLLPLRLTFVPLSAVASDNLSIDTLRLDAPAYFVGGTVGVEATLSNYGDNDIENLPVRLFVGDRERALATVDLPAGTSVTTTLHFTIDRPGWVDGYVAIADHPVTFDDSYYFTLPADEAVRLLVVDHHNTFLEKLFDGDTMVAFDRGSEDPPLDGYDAIIIDSPMSLPSGRAQSLAQWVSQGGSLVLCPAADGDVADVNLLLSLLGAPTLGEWVNRPAPVTAVDRNHALFRGVFVGSNDEMELPSTQGHYRTTSGVSQSILSFADGGDLLLCTPHDRGRLYLFTTPLESRWTSLPTQALFVPLLYNMVLYSRPLPAACHTLCGEQSLFLSHSVDPTAMPLLKRLGGDSASFTPLLPDLRNNGGRTLLTLHGEVHAAGHYSIGSEHIAFNYDRRESPLTFVTAGEVSDAVADNEAIRVVGHADKPLDVQLRELDGAAPLWRYFLLVALAALLAEVLLLRFGGRKS